MAGGWSTETHCSATPCGSDAGLLKVFSVYGENARVLCLCCGERAEFARVARPGGVRTDQVLAGVCARCVRAASEQAESDVAQLQATADRLDSYFALVRRGAARHLADWWGAIGACTREEVEQTSVTLRRTLERMGWRR